MANGNPTLGQAIGLQSIPKDRAALNFQKERASAAEEAKKRAEEEKDFDILMSDLKVDPSKYHRIDRERAAKLAQGTYQQLYDLYSKRNPNWRNQANQILYDYKFQDNQIQVDSKNKFQYEKDYSDPTGVHDKTGTDYYNWLQSGNFNQPPKIQADMFGEITEFNPLTGTVGYRRGKQYNLPQMADKAIYEPALSGYQIDPNSGRQVGKDQFFRETAVYDPVMVEGGIATTAGTPEFQGWSIKNADRIRAAAAANPNMAPEEVMFDLWRQDITSLQPKKFNEVRVSPPAQTNIYMGNGDKTEKTAGYGQKPVFVYGFTAKDGGPLTYTEDYDEGDQNKKFQTTTIDGFTLSGQDVKISSGPGVKYLGDLTSTPTGTIDMKLGDMMLVPVYKKGALQTLSGKDVNVGGVIIPDEMIKKAEEAGQLEYQVMIMGSQDGGGGLGGSGTIYAPAEQVINNATFLKEDKTDKIQLKENLDILKAKRDELNSKQGGEEPKPKKKKLY